MGNLFGRNWNFSPKDSHSQMLIHTTFGNAQQLRHKRRSQSDLSEFRPPSKTKIQIFKSCHRKKFKEKPRYRSTLHFESELKGVHNELLTLNKQRLKNNGWSLLLLLVSCKCRYLSNLDNSCIYQFLDLVHHKRILHMILCSSRVLLEVG